MTNYIYYLNASKYYLFYSNLIHDILSSIPVDCPVVWATFLSSFSRLAKSLLWSSLLINLRSWLQSTEASLWTLIHASMLTTPALVLSTKTWQLPTSNGIIVAVAKILCHTIWRLGYQASCCIRYRFTAKAPCPVVKVRSQFISIN